MKRGFDKEVGLLLSSIVSKNGVLKVLSTLIGREKAIKQVIRYSCINTVYIRICSPMECIPNPCHVIIGSAI